MRWLIKTLLISVPQNFRMPFTPIKELQVFQLFLDERCGAETLTPDENQTRDLQGRKFDTFPARPLCWCLAFTIGSNSHMNTSSYEHNFHHPRRPVHLQAHVHATQLHEVVDRKPPGPVGHPLEQDVDVVGHLARCWTESLGHRNLDYHWPEITR